MTRRSLALVANFHHERRIGYKTANFLGHVEAHLRSRDIQFNIEFVLDKPDEMTVDLIERRAAAIPESRVHIVDFGNLGASRTFGVHKARADVVCFTDGDDFFSFNWFEGALDYFSTGLRREVLHTQYMVGFDHEEFIRETMESGDPSFDPLSLAVDWYWSANLAVQTEVFARSPIEPYDHAGGFGSEDWHWACNSLAAGIARVSLPDTAYYYRVKPERLALGKVADVIHMASPLFAAATLPKTPPAVSAEPAPPAPLSAGFFAQAREIEPFELGLSYLRAVEAGGKQVRHFKPHTPPVVGAVYRGALGAGFGDESALVFVDIQRLPGGLDAAAALCDALTGAPREGRLYIVDGDKGPHHARPDGFVISLGELRALNLYTGHVDRLIARFLIQHRQVTVLNLLSARANSRALAFSRATRAGVARWVNLIVDHGFDALSQVYDELDLFGAAALESENIAVFAKTVREAWQARGVVLKHDAKLEAAYAAGALETLSGAIAPEASPVIASQGGPPRAAATRTFRVQADELIEEGEYRNVGPWLRVSDEFLDLVFREPECILVAGDAFLGSAFDDCADPRPSGIRIPALTVIHREGRPTYYLRHRPQFLNDELKAGRAPASLTLAGAIGVDCLSLRHLLKARPDRISISAIIAHSIGRARKAGEAPVHLFAYNCIVSGAADDLELLGGPRLKRGLTLQLSGERHDG